MPPPSPGESGTGSPPAESMGSGREDETTTGPQPKRARRGSAPQSSRNHRKASRRDRGTTEGAREDPPRNGGKEAAAGRIQAVMSMRSVCCRVSGWCLLAPSRGGVPQLGETRSAELTLGDPRLLYGPFPANAHPPLGVRALLPVARYRSSGRWVRFLAPRPWM